jgi:repressor LexA
VTANAFRAPAAAATASTETSVPRRQIVCQTPSRSNQTMADKAQFVAGVFALTAEGWVIVKRRAFADRTTALGWMKRNTALQARKNPSQRVRGSILETTDWMTLDAVLAEYERKRLADDPDFNDVETRIFMMNDRVTASYTARQGQYLAFIHYYTKLNGQPPAEADMQRRFMAAPPTVHQMILTLEKKGLISRTPGTARSIRVLLPKQQLPDLE